ncbi:hypothetical protein C8J56DRAFT_925207 [Mycena floridula]|nr:hypothetical protein C8J56DRAFT_925207 [Mycena floridula]
MPRIIRAPSKRAIRDNFTFLASSLVQLEVFLVLFLVYHLHSPSPATRTLVEKTGTKKDTPEAFLEWMVQRPRDLIPSPNTTRSCLRALYQLCSWSICPISIHILEKSSGRQISVSDHILGHDLQPKHKTSICLRRCSRNQGVARNPFQVQKASISSPWFTCLQTTVTSQMSRARLLLGVWNRPGQEKGCIDRRRNNQDHVYQPCDHL